MLIGLTGGIGCGKSSAGGFFAEHGFRVVDVDQIVKTQVLSNPEVVAAALARWGDGVIGPDEGLDRLRLASIVFGDSAERLWWEGVVHPQVGRIWRAVTAAEPAADWIVEIPLLFEARLEKGFDFVVCVGANHRTQLNRAVVRGLTPAQAEQRIASQLPLASKLNLSHVVLWNEGSREFLHRQVAELVHRFRTAGLNR